MGGEAVLGQLNGSISKLETFSPRMTAAINDTTNKVNVLLSSVPAPGDRSPDGGFHRRRQKAQDLRDRLWRDSGPSPCRGPDCRRIQAGHRQ
jgi:hypothetical protein